MNNFDSDLIGGEDTGSDIGNAIVRNADHCAMDRHKISHLNNLHKFIHHHNGGSLSPDLICLMIMLLRYRTFCPSRRLYPLADALCDFGIVNNTNDVGTEFNLTYQGRKIARQICPRYQKASQRILLLNWWLIRIPLVITLILSVLLAIIVLMYLITNPMNNLMRCILSYFDGVSLLCSVAFLASHIISGKIHFIKSVKSLTDSNPTLIYQVILKSSHWYTFDKPTVRALFKSTDDLLKYGLAFKQTSK